jgi:XTP/dITP diphosphohydrolase
MALAFATGNAGKFEGARHVLARYGIEIERKEIGLLEPQLDSVSQIAEYKARHAYQRLGRPCFVMDGAAYIHTLNGFPGTMTAGVVKTIGNEGILKLMQDLKDRRYTSKMCIAYMDEHLSMPKLFPYEFNGNILHEQRRSRNGFHWSNLGRISTIDNTHRAWSEFTNDECIEFERRIGGLASFAKWYIEHVRTENIPLTGLPLAADEV